MIDKYINILEFNKIIKMLENETNFELSKKMASEVMPSTDFDIVKNTLKDTYDALSLIERRGVPSFNNIENIYECLKRAEIGSALMPKELIYIAYVLKTARNLKAYISEDNHNEATRIKTLFENLVPVKALEDEIFNAIISEDEISDNASVGLSAIRRQIKNTNSKIRDILNKIIHSSKMQKFLQDSIITMRGDRFVIPVKAEHKGDVAGFIHDSSASGATVFIEPLSVYEANNELKDLFIKEKLEIEKILYSLSSKVSENIDIIALNLNIITELNFIFAKARLARKMKATMPIVNNEGRVNLKKARHPLIDKSVVVPIDINIGIDFDTLIVTGPNTGGKTVVLKTIGLLSQMAQAGLLIPAEENSDISVFENIFADIGDEQSIEQSLSTFSSHMTNIVNILNMVNKSSLVLFDELGAGTDPLEGAALGISIIEKIRQVGAKIIATTHYSELKMYAISTNGIENASCEFDVNSLKPTYKLLIGIPGKSNAFAISQKLGLDYSIIKRAKELLTDESIKFEDVVTEIEKNKQIATEQRKIAESYKTEIESLKNEILKEKELFNEYTIKTKQKMQDDAISQKELAKEEADKLIKQLHSIIQEENKSIALKKLEETRKQLKSEINLKNDNTTYKKTIVLKDAPKNIMPGTTVLLIDINQKATVLKKPDLNGNVQVQAGILKIFSHISNLKVINETDNNKSLASNKKGDIKISSIKTELDVRGNNLDDAIILVEKFIDDAIISNIKNISIIHGKGTGVLRSGIHSFLKNNKAIKSYRLGKYGEGETGVTIIELN